MQDIWNHKPRGEDDVPKGRQEGRSPGSQPGGLLSLDGTPQTMTGEADWTEEFVLGANELSV